METATNRTEYSRASSYGSNTNRGSYPSKQRKFGPAPLASFEDLPTDEANSTASSGSENDDRRTLVGESISIVISDESTPVPTPVPPIATTKYSAMQPSIEDPVERCALLSSRNQSPITTTPARKSSWIDLFTLRRPSSGTPTSTSSLTPKSTETRKLSLFNFKFFDKGDSSPKADECEMKSLLVHKPSQQKKQKPASQQSQQQHQQKHEHLNGNSTEASSPSVENTVIEIGCPIDYNNVETLVVERRDHRGSTDSIGSCPSSCSSIICCENPPIICCENPATNCRSPSSSMSCSSGSSLSLSPSSSSSFCGCNEAEHPHNTNIHNGVCSDCDIDNRPEVVSCCSETDCCENADAEDNDEEDSTVVIRTECASVTELESLLKHDDLEANLAVQMSPPKLTLSDSTSSFGGDAKNLLSPVWRHNNEQTKTSPIERPRSITPNINIGSFEAFVAEAAAAQQTMPLECDRLTVKLPGVHLSPRGRFARKSNPHIWAEFCERGLKSPQSLRKRANSCFPQLNQLDCSRITSAGLCSPDNLTPITPITPICDGNTVYSDDSDSQRHFGDHFWSTLAQTQCNCCDESLCVTSSSITTSSSTSRNLTKTQSDDSNNDCPTSMCLEDRPLMSTTDCAYRGMNVTATEDECSTQMTESSATSTSGSVSVSNSCSDSFASQSGPLIDRKSLISDY